MTKPVAKRFGAVL